MSTTAALQAVSARVERLIQRLHLHEMKIESCFSQAEGQIAGHAVRMRSRRYRGAAFESLTVAYLYNLNDKLLSVTVSGIPVAATGLPILGLDYVGFRGTLSLVALDLCPVNEPVWQARCAEPLMRLHRDAQTLVARKIPGFTQGVFSEYAIFSAAVDPAQCQYSVTLAERLLDYAEQLYGSLSDNLLLPVGSEAGHSLQQIQRWKQAMQSNKKEHSALSRIFGEVFTEKYLKAFLFSLEASPETEPIALPDA